ncbi:MAG: lytic transglycosylase domain-containing protein [Chloroflexi bacterium]|nr:lytic transglycosylase domain-containing protein [Chloroflexota bacterium]
MEPSLLAKQALIVEAAIRDPNVTGKQLKWMGHMQQVIYSRVADFPEFREPLLAALPESQRAVVAKALDAGRELRKIGSGPAPKKLPDWKIVTPPPAETLLSYYKEAEATFGVPWYYLASINLVETRMGRIRGLSSAGAQGPMQFLPATWAAYGQGDVNDPRDAILGAARYLKASGAPGNMAKALFAYNRSDFYVNAVDLYAQAMKLDPMVFRGYHGWQVYAGTVDGVQLLPEGWTKE